MSSGKTAVLLLAHGSPDRVEEVPDFLRSVTGGRPLPEAVVKEVQHRYSMIGRSPLTAITLRQGELLARELAIPVYVGMRNWRPFIADTVRRMSGDAVSRAVVLCLAPQDSRTSVGLYKKALLDETGHEPFAIDFVESWHDEPLLIRAFAERLAAGWRQACEQAGARLPVIFTAHSVPQHTISAGDPYELQARQTAQLVAVQVPEIREDEWRFAFQSQGMSGGAWLGPTVEDTITSLAELGHKGVFIQPIGFVCDHVEVLYDIDIAFRQFAGRRGMKLWRAESLNDSPTFIQALAAVAGAHLRQPAGKL